jgi:hypothetical protein
MLTEFYPFGSIITGWCTGTARQVSEQQRKARIRIRKTALDYFKAANKDTEIPRAFFVSHQWSDHDICYSVTGIVN